MTVARRELNVMVMGQANAVGLTLIEGSLFLVSVEQIYKVEVGQPALYY